MEGVFGYVSSNTIGMTVLDEDEDEVDVTLYTASKEPEDAFENFSDALNAFGDASNILHPSDITLSSTVSEGTAVIPATFPSLSRVRLGNETGKKFTFTFTNATITQRQQRAIHKVKGRVLKFTRCEFERDGHGYPLLKSASEESPLQLIFQEAVIGFSHLAKAAEEGRVKSIHFKKIEYQCHRQLESPGDLTLGQEISLRQLYKVANEHRGTVTTAHPLGSDEELVYQVMTIPVLYLTRNTDGRYPLNQYLLCTSN